jgi:hypothetical protein
MFILVRPYWLGFIGSPTTTNGAQNFGSANSGFEELAIIRNIDIRNASA